MPVLNIWLKILDFCSRPQNKVKKEINLKFEDVYSQLKKNDMIYFIGHKLLLILNNG